MPVGAAIVAMAPSRECVHFMILLDYTLYGPVSGGGGQCAERCGPGEADGPPVGLPGHAGGMFKCQLLQLLISLHTVPCFCNSWLFLGVVLTALLCTLLVGHEVGGVT